MTNSRLHGRIQNAAESPFIIITKISLYSFVLVIPNIPANARWKNNGVTVAGGNGNGRATNQLWLPWSVFVDDDQTLIIADTENDRIMQWKKDETDGIVILGDHVEGDKFNHPTDVLVDKETNSLIIADNGNRRVVQWFRGDTTKKVEILINNICCFGLAMDQQGYLYVSDGEKNEVRRYRLGNNEGTVVAGGKGKGKGPNQLDLPMHIFVDRQQNVYVSDNNNRRVMKWNKDAKEGVCIEGKLDECFNELYFSDPTGVFVDTLSTVYVADTGNHRLVRCPQSDSWFDEVMGTFGATEHEFHHPRGLSFDRYGNIYVVDQENHRVQRFDIE